MPFPLTIGSILTSAFVAAIGSTAAGPIATLDRNGAWVTIEAYGPNVIHVTIAADKAEVLKPAGFGILTDHAEHSAFRHSAAADGDTFFSSSLSLHVNAAPPPHVPSQGEKYFAPSLAPVGLQVKNARGEVILSMDGWEMAPHTTPEDSPNRREEGLLSIVPRNRRQVFDAHKLLGMMRDLP